MDNSTGHHSTGKYSTGYHSTGKYSTGYHSTGDSSTGDYSTGRGSTGWCSTGRGSTGYRSTGHYSTGDCSTGDWSISNYSTGHFSTEDYTGFGAFDKPITIDEWEEPEKPSWINNIKLTKWVVENEMTEEEKLEHTDYKKTGGYLKTYTYKEAWRNAFNEASEEDKRLTLKLPNFDADKFYEISGIRIKEELENAGSVEIEEIKKELELLNAKLNKLIK